MIKNALGVVWTLLKWGFKFFSLKNTDKMQEAKERQSDENKKDEINDAIERRDTDKIRDGLSE